MFCVQLEDIDELYTISLELGMLTYLQGLVQYDEDGIYEPKLAVARKNAEGYLWERQLEVVTKFSELLTKEDFVEPVKEY